MITLPYPPKELSPNAGKKMHHMKKARITKAYRKQIAWEIVASGMPKTINLHIVFHPRSSTADKDNAIASFKAGQDGLADGWGMKSDNDFNVTYAMGKPIKGGKVVIYPVNNIVDIA